VRGFLFVLAGIRVVLLSVITLIGAKKGRVRCYSFCRTTVRSSINVFNCVSLSD
jgi:hypothetical protein